MILEGDLIERGLVSNSRQDFTQMVFALPLDCFYSKISATNFESIFISVTIISVTSQSG